MNELDPFLDVCAKYELNYKQSKTLLTELVRIASDVVERSPVPLTELEDHQTRKFIIDLGHPSISEIAVQILAAETKEAVEAAAIDTAIEGMGNMEAGLEDLALTGDIYEAAALEEISREELTAAASDITHGVDELAAAQRVAEMSDVVAEAGVDDIEDLSAALAMMSEDALSWSMDLAGIAGQIMVAGDVVADLDMPVLSDFLRDRGNVLRQMAGDSIYLSAAMSATGAEVADLGVNEMEEGLARLAAAEGLALRSEELADLMVAGINELEESDMLDEVAWDMVTEGIAEIAVGSAELGASDVLGAIAEAEAEEDEA